MIQPGSSVDVATQIEEQLAVQWRDVKSIGIEIQNMESQQMLPDSRINTHAPHKGFTGNSSSSHGTTSAEVTLNDWPSSGKPDIHIKALNGCPLVALLHLTIPGHLEHGRIAGEAGAHLAGTGVQISNNSASFRGRMTSEQFSAFLNRDTNAVATPSVTTPSDLGIGVALDARTGRQGPVDEATPSQPATADAEFSTKTIKLGPREDRHFDEISPSEAWCGTGSCSFTVKGDRINIFSDGSGSSFSQGGQSDVIKGVKVHLDNWKHDDTPSGSISNMTDQAIEVQLDVPSAPNVHRDSDKPHSHMRRAEGATYVSGGARSIQGSIGGRNIDVHLPQVAELPS